MNWHNVSKSAPCPVCHKPDWCSVSDDGAMCFCHRVESPRLAKSGNGWIHELRANDERRMAGDGRRGWCKSPAAVRLPPAAPGLDFARVHASYDADPVLVEGLATALGVDDGPLKAMDVRLNRFDECWSFPMRDAEGRIVGLRFRELGGSRKWSARGSHDGLFYMPRPPTVSHQLPTAELIVVEGPSDAAALLSLFATQTIKQPEQSNAAPAIVGRSSCQTGAALLRQFIRRLRPRIVTIVADNDEPGIKGAELLVRQLKQSTDAGNQTMRQPMRILIVPHPHKDIRAWYLSGALTPKLFSDMASAQKWR